MLPESPDWAGSRLGPAGRWAMCHPAQCAQATGAVTAKRAKARGPQERTASWLSERMTQELAIRVVGTIIFVLKFRSFSGIYRMATSRSRGSP